MLCVLFAYRVLRALFDVELYQDRFMIIFIVLWSNFFSKALRKQISGIVLAGEQQVNDQSSLHLGHVSTRFFISLAKVTST
jgi:hypothetical protein